MVDRAQLLSIRKTIAKSFTYFGKKCLNWRWWGEDGRREKHELIYEPDFEVLKVMVGKKSKNKNPKPYQGFVHLCERADKLVLFLFFFLLLEAWVAFTFWPLNSRPKQTLILLHKYRVRSLPEEAVRINKHYPDSPDVSLTCFIFLPFPSSPDKDTEPGFPKSRPNSSFSSPRKDGPLLQWSILEACRPGAGDTLLPSPPLAGPFPGVPPGKKNRNFSGYRKHVTHLVTHRRATPLQGFSQGLPPATQPTRGCILLPRGRAN